MGSWFRKLPEVLPYGNGDTEGTAGCDLGRCPFPLEAAPFDVPESSQVEFRRQEWGHFLGSLIHSSTTIAAYGAPPSHSCLWVSATSLPSRGGPFVLPRFVAGLQGAAGSGASGRRASGLTPERKLQEQNKGSS